MPPVVTESNEETALTTHVPIVNDVVIELATVNGSGSQSANFVILRSIFKMGVPVSSKNLFPSNIEGLPTWFTIRVNADEWLAQRERVDVFVAMNPKSVEEDLAELSPGAIVILNESLKAFATRTDLEFHMVPFTGLVKEICPDTRLRKKIVNMIYVGVLAYLLDIDMDEVFNAIEHQFSSKKTAVELSQNAARAGFQWSAENLERQNRFRIERSTQTEGKIIIAGNEAAALGMLFGGVTVLAWYPITPSTSLCESLTSFLDTHRRDPETGKATYAVIQTEDEIAAMGVVIGAGWMGARACTATSGPGLSLMTEMAGLSYFAEVPAVIVDVQRMGPSTGLPTRTAQGDILMAYHLSHGDGKHVLLIPGTVGECYEFAMQSLDLAETLQTLIFVMSDLDLGMNQAMSDPFEPPSTAMQRGKILTAEDLDRIGKFDRYRDVDNDGINYRTLPGTDHPAAAYFTRGTGHNVHAEYSENSKDWKSNMDRLARKYATARGMLPAPVVDETEGARVGILAYGSSDMAVREARHLLDTRENIQTSYLRMRALPLNGEVEDFLALHDVIYVVEQNRDGQMATILRSELPESASKLKSVLHYDGLPIHAQTIIDQILDYELQ